MGAMRSMRYDPSVIWCPILSCQTRQDTPSHKSLPPIMSNASILDAAARLMGDSSASSAGAWRQLSGPPSSADKPVTHHLPLWLAAR